MSTEKAAITILFDDPFWIGLYERESAGQYAVCKITFGAEPKDYEVYHFLLHNWNRLQFSPSVDAAKTASRRINPKRMQRVIQKQTACAGIGTKAQQALQLQREQRKSERKIQTREHREEEKQRQFLLRQQKHRQKHRGH
ncbi:MAG: YjdF family protein [Clostridia bacterium]|nr:YjdF family protein [Clostridia bacterium]